MDVSELFVGEAQEAFREYVMQDDTLPRFMQEQLDAIRLIQERYAWFLDGIFAGKPFEKKKGQRKTSLAQQIEKKGLEPFVSGVSLGADSKVDAPKINAQFCIRGTGREAEQKRDAALEPYARAESEEERQRIAAELEEKLNRL